MATEIRFPVVLDDSQAAKDLMDLQRKIIRTRDALNKSSQTKLDLGKQLKEAEVNADATAAKVKALRNQLAEYRALVRNPGSDPLKNAMAVMGQKQVQEQLSEAEKQLESQTSTVADLKAKYDEVVSTIKQQTAELKEAEREAGQLEKQVSMHKKAAMIESAIKGATDSMKSGVKNLAKWGIGITGAVALARKLREYTIDAVKSFAENDPDTKASIDALSNSLNTLKASWGAAFAPVLNAVIPVLQTLISWLAAAASAIAQFFAILSGKGTFKKAVANTDKIASGMGGAADAAKEARKQLMGIDELDIMNDNNAGSGGGGGGGAGNAFEWVEEAIDTDSFIGQLALSFKDVFIDWDNLTGEQIAEKIIAGLGGLAGAVIGFSIGGVPGALIGTLAGLTLGLVADAVLFDHDGQLSTQELIQSLLVVLGYAAGGVIGFSFGNVTGAAIGATIGAALMLSLRNVTVEANAAWNAMGLLEKISLVLAAIVGGVIGFSVGGPAGAALGMAIGAELVIAIKNIQIQNDASAGGKDWVYWFLHDICHLPSDQEIIQWLWDDGLVPAFNEIGVLFSQTVQDLSDDIDEIVENLHSTWDDLKKWWSSLTLPEFHIKKPTLRWMGEFSLHPLSVPYLDITWAAKGGIVDGATLVGAGEAGKEAIVPLERNTQWIRNLALELSGMLFDEDAFTQIADKISLVPTALDRMTAQLATMTMPALPAVATGSVVPPNAAVTYTGITPELAEKLSSFLDRFGKDSGNSPIEVYPVVELDGVRVSKQLHSYTKRETRMHGKSLIEVD